MSQKKSNTPKIDGRTAAQTEVTRADVVMLFNSITEENGSDEARIDILGYVDEILDDAPKSDPTSNKVLFLKSDKPFDPEWAKID
jgi:hypothetical protein